MYTRQRRFKYSAVDLSQQKKNTCKVCGISTPDYKVVNAIATLLHLIQAAVLIIVVTTQSMDRSVPLQEQYTNWIPESKTKSHTYTIEFKDITLDPSVVINETQFSITSGTIENKSFDFDIADTNESFNKTNFSIPLGKIKKHTPVYTIQLDDMALDLATVPTKSDFSIGWGVIVFFLLSGVFQGVNWFRKEYTEEKTNPLRFIEYSISASIMLVLIALVNGIFDQSIIILLAVSCAACQLCGLVSEQLLHLYKVHKNDTDLSNHLKVLAWVAHITGWLLILTAYAIIFRYYDISNRNSDGQAPEFVTIIVISIFVLFSSFGVVQLLEMTETIEYEIAELVYVCLSLTAKSLLGWIIFANVLVS